MNQQLELVEKLIEKTGIGYAEAKAALEKTDWDILEAMILLESEGKINKTTSSYTTQKPPKPENERKRAENAENFKQQARSFGEWLRGVIDKGNRNCLEMYRGGERILSIPVTVFVLLLIVCFWCVLPAMFVSLFLGCRYAFSGPELGRDSVNQAMGKATDIADGIKNEISKKPEQ